MWRGLCITIKAHKCPYNLETENYICISILCNTFLDSQYKTSVVYFCNITHISGWICTSKYSVHIRMKLQQNNVDRYRYWIITEINILKSSAVSLSLAIMQLIQFKPTSCYNTELPYESPSLELWKLSHSVPTFKTTMANYYHSTSKLSHCIQHQSHL